MTTPTVPAPLPTWAWDAIGAEPDGDGWKIPERNAEGEIIGWSRRFADGSKGFVKGGKRGLTMKHPLDPYAGTAATDPVFIVEGATDAAAGVVLLIDAVGRPGNRLGGKLLADLLADRHVCIIAENDAKPGKDAGTVSWPGRDGADAIARKLLPRCASVRIIFPPEGVKDLRAWLAAGVTRDDILELVAGAEPMRETEPTKSDAARAKATADDNTQGPAQAEQLVRLALELFRLGQTAKREPFAVQNSGANVAGLLRGSGGPLRDKLAREYRARYGRVMNATAYADALATIRGEALETVAESVHIRVGPNGDGVALDLGTVDGATVLVDAHGWRIADRSPILYQRTALTGIVPTPVAGGRIDALRELLNVSDETWPILLGWIVAALIPDMPHPILMFGGQQGTGKTTASRYICGLFDPSDAPTRSQPRDPEAWVMSIANCWAAVIDNVSSIPAWWSDALCKAVTGDGWIRRTLYTDGDISVLSFRRVIVLTSIDAGALRGDLGERLVLVDLEPIEPSKRRTERELDAIYERERPAILGALLDLLAGVLARLDAIDLPELPRMADFARVLAAVDATLGTDSLGLYADQGRRIAGEVIDGDAVGEAVLAFVGERGKWSGPVGELLLAIRPENFGREWPKTPRGLAGRLRQLAPAMRLQGVEVIAPAPTERTREYHLQPTAQTARPRKIGPGELETGIADRAVGRAVQTDGPDRPGDGPGDNGRLQAGKADYGRSGDSGGRAQETAHPAAGESEAATTGTPATGIAAGPDDGARQGGCR